MSEANAKIRTDLIALLGSLRNEFDVFFIGSLSEKKKHTYRQVSDIDLTVESSFSSMAELTARLETTLRLRRVVQQRYEDSEIFFMSPYAKAIHFNVLSTIAGMYAPDTQDYLLKNIDDKTDNGFDGRVRHRLYMHAARQFCNEYSQLLPCADTAGARKIAKEIMRGLKLTICANATSDTLSKVEADLFTINDFAGLNRAYPVPLIGAAFQRALDGEVVQDWSEWMEQQETLAGELMRLAMDADVTPIWERRRYNALLRARCALIVGVKDIIMEPSDSLRANRITKYADEAAEIIAQLALNGVNSLKDFSHNDHTIKECQAIIAQHLHDPDSSMRCFAASVLLLEHAFRETVTVEKLE